MFSTKHHRMIVKLDAKTGAEIWTMLLPTTQSNIGKKAGYETIAFTSDGGFIVGGYCKYTAAEFPFFKSSGQVSKIHLYENHHYFVTLI